MRIEHIAMYVNDLEAAKDFFVTYLGGASNNGYHNNSTDFQSYFISFDDGARLELMNKPLLIDTDNDLNRTGYAPLGMRTRARGNCCFATALGAENSASGIF